MAGRKESSTGSDRESVSAKTAKKSVVAGKKPAAAAKKTTVAKESPVQVKTPVARKKVARKPVAAAAPTAVRQKPTITREDRQRMICEAAYLISSKRPPYSGSPEIDWVQAEAVIDMVFDATD